MYLHGVDIEKFTCILLDLSVKKYSARNLVFLAIVHMTYVSMKTVSLSDSSGLDVYLCPTFMFIVSKCMADKNMSFFVSGVWEMVTYVLRRGIQKGILELLQKSLIPGTSVIESVRNIRRWKKCLCVVGMEIKSAVLKLRLVCGELLSFAGVRT